MSEMNIEQFELLNSLTPEEKEAALAILKELGDKGYSEKLNDLIYSDYDEIPVDIETFMFDKRYLGNGLVDAEGRITVFPFWVETLKKIFPNNIDTAYNTIIFTGAIGIGKSFIAVICQLYLMYRMLCLKDPYLYYGMQPIDKISFAQINITLDAAKGVAWDKMQQLLQSSPWFMSHGKITGKDELVWKPIRKPGQIGTVELVVGSKNSHIIGRAVFCAFEDEVNFSAVTTDVDKIKRKMLGLITQTDARMISRFLRGNRLPTLNIIASSKNSDQSFLDQYIETKKKNESKTTLIIDKPQWVVDSRKNTKEKFWVAIGNKFLASEVLPKNAAPELVKAFRDKGYQMMEIPIGYWEPFNDNVEIALNDLAGISTVGARKYIAGPRWTDVKTKEYKNPFTRDVITVGNAEGDETQYSEFFDLKAIPEEMKRVPMFVHLDLSKSGDKTGIAGVWVLGKKPGVEVPTPKEVFYKVAFSVSVAAPKGYEISFEKNRIFVRWLKEQGFKIKGVSFDTFQSTHLMQQLKGEKFNPVIVSVDRLEGTDEKDEKGNKHRVCKPYEYFHSTLYERRMQVYDKCDLLTEEVLGLERQPDGHINHPDNGATGSKDQIDAVVGAMYNASLHVDEIDFEFGEVANAFLDSFAAVNNKLSNEEIKKQMIKEFEEELKNRGRPVGMPTQNNQPQGPIAMDNMLLW